MLLLEIEANLNFKKILFMSFCFVVIYFYMLKPLGLVLAVSSLDGVLVAAVLTTTLGLQPPTHKDGVATTLRPKTLANSPSSHGASLAASTSSAARRGTTQIKTARP